jgi:hypothetical protein
LKRDGRNAAVMAPPIDVRGASQLRGGGIG